MLKPTLADLGELELLRRLQIFCASGVGDDAFVQTTPPGASLVVTTDVLVDKIHFSQCTVPPELVGWRAVAVNLSDLAAMGATPLGITVGAALPPETPWEWLKAVYEGMQSCLQTYGGDILGGDVTRSTVKTLSITALGYGESDQTIYRHTAQPQQAILVTGIHGAAQAGLALLTGDLNPKKLAETLRWQWINAHQRPIPRLDAIATLKTLAQAQSIQIASNVAGMDSSDGLANAVIQLCQRSGVGAQILRSQLPLPPGLAATVGQKQAESWTLYGGEDFELVLCLPESLAQALVAQLGPPCQIIGYTTATHKIELVDSLDDASGIPLTLGQSYQHFV